MMLFQLWSRFANLNPRRKTGLAIVLAVLVVVGLSLAAPARADLTAEVNNLIGKLLLAIAELIGRLLVIAINILISVAQYNDFGGSPAVKMGFAIVRDVANMVFIVFLLIIAFATILKIENYRYNQLLSRLLLMAVLVNFANLITLFFIDATQVIMLTFVSAFKDAAAGNLTSAFGLSEALKFLKNNHDITQVNDWSVITTILLAIAVYIIALITTGVMIVVLVIRIFALWVLIILSPMAYALRAFPNTKAQSTKWWSNFGKYATTGPVVAFFLWLALTIMSSGDLTKGFQTETARVTSSSEVAAVSADNSGGNTEIKAALSDISSASGMLNFMFAIAFLLTGLSVAQGLGGAAGKIAGDWSEKIKKGGLKAAGIVTGAAAVGGAAKVAGFGAKAFLGGRLDWMEAKLGVPLRYSKYKEGIEKASKRHREDMEDEMAGKALERFRGGEKEVMRKKNFKGITIAGKRILGIAYGEKEAVIDKKTGKVKTKYHRPNVLLGALADPEYLWYNFGKLETLKKAMTGRFGELTGSDFGLTEQQFLKQSPEVKAKAERAEKLMAWKNADEYYVDTEVSDHVQKTIDDRVARIANLRMNGTDEEKEKYNKTMGKGPDGKDKEKTIDEVMKENGIDPDWAADSVHKQEFLKVWDEKKAGEELNLREIGQKKQEELQQLGKTELFKLGREKLEKKSDAAREDSKKLARGEMREKDLEDAQKELEKIDKILEQIDKDLEGQKAAGMDTTFLDAQKANWEKEKQERKTARDAKQFYWRNDEEKQRGEKWMENESKRLAKEADDLKEQATVYVSDEDRVAAGKSAKDAQLELQKIEKRLRELRPAAPYEMLRDLRASINEKKKQLTSDSWKEHLRVLEDAVRNKDFTLASAALLRSTEYGNENEILNSFGYDSNELKAFIEDIFVKKMGMSEEQALAVATDVSYTAEDKKHWGIARTTEVVNGRQVWAEDKDRQKEVLAEIRKVDFEDFYRRANRLGWGHEIVGLKQFGRPDGTPEDRERRAAYFRAGGERDFEMDAYSQAFLEDTYAGVMRNIGQGRFNPNLAINLVSDSNEELMRMIGQSLGNTLKQGEQNKFWTFQDFRNAIREFTKSAPQSTTPYSGFEHFYEQRRYR